MTEKKKTSFTNFLIVKECKVIGILLWVLLLSSCEQRDPQAEYEILCEKEFLSPRDGVEAAQEYIDYFQKNEKARITEVSEIRDLYRKIDVFFSDSFNSYADFLNKSRDLNYELLYCNYNGVRRLWQSLYEKERKRLLAPLMDSITESDFDTFFKTQVRLICENSLGSWNIESIEQVSLSTPIVINDGTAKKSSGEYLVNLQLKAVEIIKNTARLNIEGTIGPDENGLIRSNRTSFSFLDKPFVK